MRLLSVLGYTMADLGYECMGRCGVLHTPSLCATSQKSVSAG